MPRLLEGKIAVITGGATRIGLAAGKKFVAEGSRRLDPASLTTRGKFRMNERM
jgi:NAD(P)-dependent dehydrogenase (short-subunit alcohol dehydrogenase family)